MKNVKMLVERAVSECEAIGIKVGYIERTEVNFRAKRRWGQCRKVRNHYIISISNQLLADDVSDEATMNTIVHEVLHTVEGCGNHKAKWKALANKMNREYGYNIKRTTTASEKGLEDSPYRKAVNYRYRVVCQDCGREEHYARESKVIKLLEGKLNGYAVCPCGSRKFTLYKDGWRIN